ncbi:MAG: ketosteroid isomerase-like protein [Spirosomataceae bacterium]|jgi:ketosteroid isomerase-like protein
MQNEETIKQFYQSFSDGNADGMVACYHDDIVFKDPAFGTLEGDKAKAMWQMLMSRSDSAPEIQFSNISADAQYGKANWIAKYNYGPKKRKVVNNVTALFEFKDGKIIKHTDDFDLWKWSQQALGASGYLLGWSSFMKKQIQKKTNGLLGKFIENS